MVRAKTVSSQGGNIMLNARSTGDLAHSCSPEVTFFGRRVLRYMNFAEASLLHSIGAGGACAPLLSPGRTARTQTTTIERVADYVGNMYVRTHLPALNTSDLLGTGTNLVDFVADTTDINEGSVISTSTVQTVADLGIGAAYVDAVALFIVSQADLMLNNILVDRVTSNTQYLDWLSRHDSESRAAASIGLGTEAERVQAARADQVVYTPLQFYNFDIMSQVLPHVAMHAQDLQLKMTGRGADDMWGFVDDAAESGNLVATTTAQRAAISTAIAQSDQDLVIVSYFLSEDMRQETAYGRHEYLITQHQFPTTVSVAQNSGATVDMQDIVMKNPMRQVTFFFVADRHRNGVLNAFQPDRVYPFKSSLITGEYKTPMPWTDFSVGHHPRSGERVSPFTNVDFQFNNHTRFLKSTTSSNPATSQSKLYQVVDPSHRHAGDVTETHAYWMSFGIYGDDDYPSGTANGSAVSNLSASFVRAVSPSSLWTGTWGGAAAAFYPPPAYPAGTIHVVAKSMNQLVFEGGVGHKVYA